jgi:sec-independent protein translocase protein TatA
MLGGNEVLIVLVIVLLLFGSSQVPKLARNLGKAQKEFKDGLDTEKDKDKEKAKAADGETSTPADS